MNTRVIYVHGSVAIFMYECTPPSVWTLTNKHRSTRKQKKSYNIKRIIEFVIATPLLLKYKIDKAYTNAYTFVFNRLYSSSSNLVELWSTRVALCASFYANIIISSAVCVRSSPTSKYQYENLRFTFDLRVKNNNIAIQAVSLHTLSPAGASLRDSRPSVR